MPVRVKYVLQFSRRDDLQDTGFDPAIQNRRIVWTFNFEAAGSKRKEAFYKINDFTLLHVFTVVTPNNRCNYLSMLAVKFLG